MKSLKARILGVSTMTPEDAITDVYIAAQVNTRVTALEAVVQEQRGLIREQRNQLDDLATRFIRELGEELVDELTDLRHRVMEALDTYETDR